MGNSLNSQCLKGEKCVDLCDTWILSSDICLSASQHMEVACFPWTHAVVALKFTLTTASIQLMLDSPCGPCVVKFSIYSKKESQVDTFSDVLERYIFFPILGEARISTTWMTVIKRSQQSGVSWEENLLFLGPDSWRYFVPLVYL